jgi:hypothetical protein
MQGAVVDFSSDDVSDHGNLILHFYRGSGTDHRGRRLSQILQKSDRWLEETHDYIQWLFPLYVRMLIFYGYSFSPLAADVVSPIGEWADKAENWLTDGNHNFMRITRMLRSMMLLGRQELARSFHSVLVAAARAHPKIISKRTLSFWDEAISISLTSSAEASQESAPSPADTRPLS